MQLPTDVTSTSLPREGQLIEFVVDGHDVTMAGTYAQFAFRSYHLAYPIDQVVTWRPLESERSRVHARPPIDIPASGLRYV